MLEDIKSRLGQICYNDMDHRGYLLTAVLIPIIEHKGSPEILFEVRSKNMSRQPGEVCFPGGKIEETERGAPLEAALRETREELGLEERDIEVLGSLNYVVLPYGTVIYPFAGKIKRCPARPNPLEVEETFTVPLDYFLNTPPAVNYADIGVRYGPNFPYHMVPPAYREGWQVRWTTPMYSFQYNGYFIWGFTARVLYNFIKLCWPENPHYK